VNGPPSVAIVGGGILGMTAAYRLAQKGVRVALYERSSDLGGLVGSFDFNGYPVDRFYHVVLPTDDRVRSLAEELGLGDRFRFRPTKVGFYGDGRLFSMTSPKELLTFPLLRLRDRLRLGAFVARCQLTKTHDELDETPLLDWLRRRSGKNVLERMWAPLLDSKFDGRYDDLPATYIWARTRRMSKTRDKSGAEVMGWLEGGYQTLIDALEHKIRELGGEIHAGTSVEKIVGGGSGGAEGLAVEGVFRPFDFILCTLAPPMARSLLAPELLPMAPPAHCRYLGVVCLLLRTRRSISPYYHLNITDRRIPLTTVVETTHVVDPDQVGGHLVYVSKYVDPSSPLHDRPAEEIEREFVAHAKTIFDLRDEDILASVVQRARVTEPVHTVGGARNLPDMFSVPGLALASTAHVYPEIVSGQAVTGVAERVLPGILERLPARERAAA
jgi:protoporphyrinogen oxidase